MIVYIYLYRLILIIWCLIMVFKDNNVQHSTFVLKKLDDGIPEDHMCSFIKKFVLKEFKYLDDKNYKKMGMASYSLTSC